MANTTLVAKLTTLRNTMHAKFSGGSKRERAQYSRLLKQATLQERVHHVFGTELERVTVEPGRTGTAVRYQNGRGHIGGGEDVMVVGRILGAESITARPAGHPVHLAEEITFWVPLT